MKQKIMKANSTHLIVNEHINTLWYFHLILEDSLKDQREHTLGMIDMYKLRNPLEYPAHYQESSSLTKTDTQRLIGLYKNLDKYLSQLKDRLSEDQPLNETEKESIKRMLGPVDEVQNMDIKNDLEYQQVDGLNDLIEDSLGDLDIKKG
ncbi:hypothetical protein [Falsibacillus albus]|nr:hypothetical protein [Falsibacillus albus]